jgi:hypothetical protein
MSFKERPNRLPYIRALRRMSFEGKLKKAYELTDFPIKEEE